VRGCCPNEVVEPINWGGRSSQESVKFNPSPKLGGGLRSDESVSKKFWMLSESAAVKIGSPGAGSGGGSRKTSWLSLKESNRGREK